MKKVFAIVCAVVLSISAQTTDTTTTVAVKLSDLPTNIQEKYKSAQALADVENTAQKMTTVAQSAEAIGKSVGSAMREGLGALTEEANKFADTKVGMFTAVIIAWKVMGDDAMNLFSGIIFVVVSIPLAFVILCIWVWSFRRLCLPSKEITTTTVDGKTTTTAKLISPEQINLISDSDASVLIHWAVFIGAGLIYVIMLWNAIF